MAESRAQVGGETGDRVILGIGSVQAAVLFFVFQDLIMKQLLQAFPVWQLQFLRSFFGLIPLAFFAWLLVGTKAFVVEKPRLHVIRGFLGFFAYTSFYVALGFMPLAQAAALFYTGPIFISLLSVPFLGERLGVHRIAAVLVGFAGVLIVLRPDTGGFDWISVLPLICALCYAISMIIIRKASVRESSAAVAFYTHVSFMTLSLIFSGLGWSFVGSVPSDGAVGALLGAWAAPSQDQWLLILCIAVAGVVGHVLIATAYRSAPASVIAPFDYTYLIWAPLLAFFAFTEVPSDTMLLGIGLIAGSGLYIGFRETRRRRAHGKRPAMNETIILPNTAPRTPPKSPEHEPRRD